MKQIEITRRWTKAKESGDTALVAAYAALGETQVALKSTKRRLADSATSAIMRLERLVEMTDAYDTEADGQPPQYNEMGTLQGLGSEIDRLTGEMALQVKMFATMHKLVEAIENPQCGKAKQ